MCYKTGVIGDRSFTLRKQVFSTFRFPVTLIFARTPSCTNLTHIPWRSTGNELLIRQDFRKLSSDRQTHKQTDTQTDRQTNRQTWPKLYTTPLLWFSITESYLTRSVFSEGRALGHASRQNANSTTVPHAQNIKSSQQHTLYVLVFSSSQHTPRTLCARTSIGDFRSSIPQTPVLPRSFVNLQRCQWD